MRCGPTQLLDSDQRWRLSSLVLRGQWFLLALDRSLLHMQASSLFHESQRKERPDWDALPVARPVLVLRRGGSRCPVLDLQEFAAGQAAKVLEEFSAIYAQDVTCLVAKAPGEFVVDPSFRAQDWEEAQWKIVAETWRQHLQPFLPSSPFFKDLGDLALDTLWKLLRAKASGTLRRHLPGFKLIWLDFIRGSDIVTAEARVCTVVSFLLCIQRGNRACGAPVSAQVRGRAIQLGSVPGKLGKSRRGCLVWTSYTDREARKEAVLLPLIVIAINFEMAVHDCVRR